MSRFRLYSDTVTPENGLSRDTITPVIFCGGAFVGLRCKEFRHPEFSLPRSSPYTTSRSCAMESLPDELLLQIFEIVSTQIWQTKGLYSTNYLRRTRNLQRISLVSRKFHRIVTPLLYENVVGPIFLSVPFWSCIVRTVHQHPDLAQLIKRFSMTKPNPPFHNSPPQSLRSELSVALLSELYSYDGFLPEVALLDLEHRSKRRDYILMTFMILKASALKELNLTGYEATWGPRSHTRLPLLIEEMGLRIYREIDAGRSPQCFEHLCSLRIELDEWGYFPADAVIPFLYLPRLRSLMLEGWGLQTKRRKRSGFRLFGSGREWPVRSSCIEDLTFDCNGATVKQVCQSRLHSIRFS